MPQTGWRDGRGGAVTTAADYGLTRRIWHQLEPIHAMFWYAPEVFAEAEALGYDVQTGGRATSPGRWRRWEPSARAQRLAELTTPLLVAAFESGLLPPESTLGIAHVPAPSVRT